jgi:hypothetical protein
MTQKQARHALAAIASRGDSAQTNSAQHGAPVTVWLNSVGKAFSGRAQLDDSGLVVIDGGRVYIRAEQISVIEAAEPECSPSSPIGENATC